MEHHTVKFDEDEIDAIFALAKNLTGTTLTRTHHSIILQNLATRIEKLNVPSLEAYLRYVGLHPEELSHTISALTVHTTSWWREPTGFQGLYELAIKWAKSTEASGIFRVLSIACSTGEEVYSAAAQLQSIRKVYPEFSYEVDGWDIDPISVQTAKRGHYSQHNLGELPLALSQLLLETADDGRQVRVKSDIAERVRFRAVNILAPPKDVNTYNFIFCRNMMIYFEPAQVEKIISYITSRLKDDGLFCVGLSETGGVNRINYSPMSPGVFAPIARVSSVVRKTEGRLREAAANHSILLVDDDADLLSTMQEHLQSLEYSVKLASNFEEAVEVIKREKIGLVICDQKLEKDKRGTDIARYCREGGFKGKFIILSGHADIHLVNQSSELGITDVILKPCSGEDLSKLVADHFGPPPPNMTRRPELIVLGASTGGTEVLSKILQGMPQGSPPVLVVQHIAAEFSQEFAARLAKQSHLTLAQAQDGTACLPGHLYMAQGDYHIAVKRHLGTLQ